jgi:nucleoside-diphosphate-sugar epimerase
VYNIGGVQTMKIGDILDMLASFVDCEIRHEVDPALLRPSDVTLQIPDISKFQDATGWKPEIPVETTMLDLLDYHRARITKNDKVVTG